MRTANSSASHLKLSWMIILPYTHLEYVCFIANYPLEECLKAVAFSAVCNCKRKRYVIRHWNLNSNTKHWVSLCKPS